MNNTSEAWQDGYDAGFTAGRRSVEGTPSVPRVAPPVSDTSWNYEGLGGYGSQER